jgi:hypothetical protein
MLHPKSSATQDRKQRKANTRKADEAFRLSIWTRDGGRDRATGQPLQHQSDNWDTWGQVCHLKGKGAHPERRHDLSNAILLSMTNHILSDGRGHYRLKILGEDANQTLIFRLTDRDGNVLWERTSKPPSNY